MRESFASSRVPWWIAIVAVTASLAEASVTSAQQAGATEPVSRELLRALLGNDIEILVGRTPEDLPRPLQLPAGARVLGTILGYFGGTTIVAVAPIPPGQAEQAARRALTEGGWTEPPQMDRKRTHAVFVDNHTLYDPARWLCNGDIVVDLTVAPWGVGEAYLRYGYRSSMGQQSVCSPNQAASRNPFEHLPRPELRSPPGARIQASQSGGGGSSDDYHARARIQTSLPPAELLRYYAAQLAEQGWLPEPETTNANGGIQLWRLQEATGKRWYGTLTVVAIPDRAERTVQFYLVQAR